MTEQELKKMNRQELRELLASVSKENEALRARIEQLEVLLEDRTIVKDKAGSIAEAALQLNDVFGSAQKAADQYLSNVCSHEQYCLTRRTTVEQEADFILAAAEEQAEQLRVRAEKEAEAYWTMISKRIEDLNKAHPDLWVRLEDDL